MLLGVHRDRLQHHVLLCRRHGHCSRRQCRCRGHWQRQSLVRGLHWRWEAYYDDALRTLSRHANFLATRAQESERRGVSASACLAESYTPPRLEFRYLCAWHIESSNKTRRGRQLLSSLMLTTSTGKK